MDIRFGTDGWRAVISDTFTFANVRLVAQAIADVVCQQYPDVAPVRMVVGFDTRFLSDRYAREVACVLAANGIQVDLTHADTPTPVISHAIVLHRAQGGVMITASHNPPRYNGIKFKAAYGGSASPADCKRVEARLLQNEQEGRKPLILDFDEAHAQGLIRRFDPRPAYRDHLATLVDFETIGRGGLRVVVDAMYGAGRGYLAEFLRDAGAEVVELRGEMNPGFNGIHPEPIERYLQPLAEALSGGDWHLGLATDGDADRIGAMAPDGRFIDPHVIMSLSLRYLIEQRQQRGMVVKTVSTTQMLNRLAARYGLELRETPVGFNHISDLMMNHDVLIGGEESGGISIKGHIPEGDGVLMGMLLAEILAAHGGDCQALLNDLVQEVGAFYYARNDFQLRTINGQPPFTKSEMVQRLMQSPPATLAGMPVARVLANDGVKYMLQDDSWLLIRPSGTEPVLRMYAEARSAIMVTSLLQAGETLVPPPGKLNGSH
ncbi:phosphoglucomutase/phosphomannomutase family protein [Candidatus Amarolinea dominans]|uniref:phosphoglucomutase/phosphomannomutase family protein n=1 Tax=Candidatus Amarolinea dominans TaxID=3140696 RepID=UPI001D93E101|nr:phosphoglucomutase/phosphomannomutase family protein [Anaerolineae bacterium]MBK7203222.1 phosphoglucomutase/phosphomannomutase family protein [Anaerolineae bacterium]MBK9093566.1 phosphoglucomutase/phosphomannomutase family protein [Anaerolineae bacterium]